MRQAGRYMNEYREMRSKVEFLELCKTPDLAAEVTLLPVEQLQVDAAIIFADILLPLEPMGAGLRYSKGDGPVIDRPVRCHQDVDRLRTVCAEESLAFVADAITATLAELPPEFALIGFAGAPFTLAAYLIEGGSSRTYDRTKAFMLAQPQAWLKLMEMLADITADYLNLQVEAGACAVQLFDSWVGCLSRQDYSRYVYQYSQRAIREVQEKVPVIHFSTGSYHLIKEIKKLSVQVISLDWRVPLGQAWELVGYDKAVQGNLDPAVLLTDKDVIRACVREILEGVSGRPGHIFNLGHGVLPATPEDNVRFLVESVHELSRR